MSTPTELISLAGGPSIFGVGALSIYIRDVLADYRRIPRMAWRVLASCAAMAAWLSVFIVWAAPTVFESWLADGKLQVDLFLLSASWIVAIGLLTLDLAWHVPRSLRYLDESYPSGTAPWVILRIRAKARGPL